MALFESARKRQRIQLPLRTKLNPLAYMIENGDLPVEWPGHTEVRSGTVRGESMSWHDSQSRPRVRRRIPWARPQARLPLPCSRAARASSAALHERTCAMSWCHSYPFQAYGSLPAT